MIVREAGPADAAAIARVHVDTWRTTYPAVVPDDYLAQLSYDERADTWRGILANTTGNTFVYVAEDETHHIAGFANGGPAGVDDPLYRGELYSIYILAAYQRLGLGRRLVAAIAERLAAAGMHTMLVWALLGSPSCRFYEALGGRPVRRTHTTMGSVTVEVVAYGWRDTTTLWDNGGTTGV